MSETYIIVAYAVLFFTFLFCGILRLCNLFPQVIKNMEDCYPARKVVAGVYFSVLLLFPCMLHPRSYDALLFARCFWIIYIPLSASLAFRCFWGTDRRRGVKDLVLVGTVPAIVTLALFAFAVTGGDGLRRYGNVVVGLAEIISMALTVYLFCVALWIWNMIRGKWGGINSLRISFRGVSR